LQRIDGVIWLEEIVEKLWRKHRVREAEVVEVLSNRPRFRFVERGHREAEDVYAALGRTESSRLLIVFFVLKKDQQALIVSARDMTSTERRNYERK
jgi:uncharacterized DUF497 family protein